MPDTEPFDYRKFITIEPGKRSGNPAGGMSESELLEKFPDLTADDIRACRAFAVGRECSSDNRA